MRNTTIAIDFERLNHRELNRIVTAIEDEECRRRKMRASAHGVECDNLIDPDNNTHDWFGIQVEMVANDDGEDVVLYSGTVRELEELLMSFGVKEKIAESYVYESLCCRSIDGRLWRVPQIIAEQYKIENKNSIAIEPIY